MVFVSSSSTKGRLNINLDCRVTGLDCTLMVALLVVRGNNDQRHSRCSVCKKAIHPLGAVLSR